MILRKTIVDECWCPNCSEGQIANIHDILFVEKISDKDLIGRKIKCKCGVENVINDIITFIPTAFYVASSKDISKFKSNEELSKWLSSE